MEPTEEPVAELEVGGSVYSYYNWSEVLWIHRVNRCRTRRTGLALLFGKISDFSLSHIGGGEIIAGLYDIISQKMFNYMI